MAKKRRKQPFQRDYVKWQLSCPRAIRERVRDYSRAEGRSMSWIVAEALREWFARLEREPLR